MRRPPARLICYYPAPSYFNLPCFLIFFSPAAAHDGGIISYNRANNLRLCVHLGLP